MRAPSSFLPLHDYYISGGNLGETNSSFSFSCCFTAVAFCSFEPVSLSEFSNLECSAELVWDCDPDTFDEIKKR